jgi:hypothetical protein
MTQRSGGYRGLARGLAVAGVLSVALAAMTGCSAHGPAGPTVHPRTVPPKALPKASCGEAGTHELSGTTQFFRADKGALSCFATAVRHCQSASIAITEMGVDTGTDYVFAVVPGQARCQATEWSQDYSANFGGSQGPVVQTHCSATAGADGVKLGCGGQDLLIPTTATSP